MDFEEILIYHFKKYPLMMPKDAVKLCYQSAFGCGHLIKNKEMALSMLKNEMENIQANNDAQLYETIGNGYARLDLHAAKAKCISAENICKVFIKTANSGEKTALEPKTELLKKLAAAGKTPFTEKALLDYLEKYNGEMVSHSEEYKKAYDPAYRVILEKETEDLH